MPFRSKKQRSKFWAMADRGEISESKVREWEHKTKNKKSLPERVSKKEGSWVFSRAYSHGARVALTKIAVDFKQVRTLLQLTALGKIGKT